MNTFTNFLLAAAIASALAPLGARAMPDTCEEWIDKAEAGYKITFDGRTYNGGSDTTEFCWTVEVDADFSSAGEIKGLSHWVIGVCPGSTLISTSGPDAEGNLQVDPATGLYGHKWDHEMEDGASPQQFCITLDGNIPSSSSDMTFDGNSTTKGGKICSTCPIEGPGCPRDCPAESCPAGQVRDADTCECECINTDVPCADGEQRNADTCLCECIPDSACVDPKEQTDDCDCLCKDRDVPCEFPGQERNERTCECECLALPICIAPAELVGCECVCDPNGTAEIECVGSGRFWNPEACSCDDDPPIVVCKTVKAKCGCPLVKDWDAVDCIKIVWVENDTGRCDAEDTD